MKPFLESFTDYLLKYHFHDLSVSCVVFPSRRAGVFFTKYLSANINKTTFLPETTTLNEFIYTLSDLQTADPIYLLYLLYDVFKKQTGIDESFDEFYFWGQVILADFNDIDKELADAEKLYSNLSDIKEIENRFSDWNEEQIRAIEQFWGVMDSKSEVPARKKFLSLWEKLFSVYKEFNKVLDELNIGYDGRIYRNVVKKLSESPESIIEVKKLFVVGFNALSRSERRILKLLKSMVPVEFFWDFDEYYFNNNEHEAGYFLRMLVGQFPPPEKFVFETGILKPKQINIYSVPTQVGQAKILNNILKDISDPQEQVAVVLADETMLLPVLYSIPDSVEKLNVTMEFPVKQSQAMQMIDGLLSLQSHIKTSKNATYFKVRDVNQFFSLPYFREFDYKEEILRELKENIRPVIDSERLRKDEFTTMVFSPVEDPNNYCEYLSRIIPCILENSKNDDDSDRRRFIDKQVLYSIYRETLKLNEILTEFNIQFTKAETFIKIYRQFLANVRVSFRGEPLAGMQVMGILESRLLDFKNLVLLSVNEGIFPKNSVQLSLIPYNLRKGFGLLTQEHQDAIFSYHFYHMLQRTENLSLVYSTKQNDFGKSEVSRYIHQIKFDERIKLSNYHISDKAGIFTVKPIVIKRNHRIRELLNEYLEGKRKLSPTSVSAYINCKLMFYFKYLAKLTPPDEITDEMDGKMFGNILHLSLGKLYFPLIGKTVNEKDVEYLLKDIQLDSALNQSFNEVIGGGGQVDYKTGKLLINFQILKNYVKRVLYFDKQTCPFFLKGFEIPVQYTILANIENKKHELALGGYIDRLIEKEGKLFVQDFKTGNVETKTKSIDDLFKETDKKDYAAIRQVFIYSLSLGFESVRPQILSVRKKLSQEEISIYIEKEIVENIQSCKEEFAEKLNETVEQLFMSDEFTQTEYEKNCEWCDYKQICRR